MSNPLIQKRSPLEINEPDTGAQPPGIGWTVEDDNAQLQLLALQMLSDLPRVAKDDDEPRLLTELAGLIPPEAKELEPLLVQAIDTFQRDHLLFTNLDELYKSRVKQDESFLHMIDDLSVLPGTKTTIEHLKGERSRWLTFTQLMGQNGVIPMRTLPRRIFVTTLAGIYVRIEYAKTGKARQLTQADFKYSRKRCPGFVSFLLSVFGAVKGLTTLSGDVSDSQVRVFKNKLDQYWQDYHKQLNQIERDFQEPTE